VMNPNPFDVLKNFTVPLLMVLIIYYGANVSVNLYPN
jgi:hypothetical protein